MALKDKFNQLIGKPPAPISQEEAFRRAVVRDGNKDYAGRRIDRNAGQPISGRPEQSGFRERVNEFLERSGVRIERRNPHISELPDQIFNKEVAVADHRHVRRFDDRNRDNVADDIKQINRFLHDGAVEPPKKQGES